MELTLNTIKANLHKTIFVKMRITIRSDIFEGNYSFSILVNKSHFSVGVIITLIYRSDSHSIR